MPALEAPATPLAIVDIDIGADDPVIDHIEEDIAVHDEFLEGGEDILLDDEWVEALTFALEQPLEDTTPEPDDPVPPPPPLFDALLIAEPLPSTLLVLDMFGCFRVTRKDTRAYGSLQINCPFHKRNSVTGCKRSFRINGPTPHDLVEAIRYGLRWAILASEYERQRHHLHAELPFHCLPSTTFYRYAPLL